MATEKGGVKPQTKFARKTYDQPFKDLVIQAVRSGQKTVADVCKDENIQPYQVYAWIGEKALSDSLSKGDATDISGAFLQLDESAMTDPDLARAIGEWWLRTHAVKKK